MLIGEVWSAHRLLRPIPRCGPRTDCCAPFLGTGVLGGYTTFSTYTVDAHTLLDGGHARLRFAYLAATLVCALAAVYVGGFLTRWATTSRRSSEGRYLTDRAVQSRQDSLFRAFTFTVNVVGLILGVLAGGATAGAVSGSAIALLDTSLRGPLSTYSTFGYETLH